MNVKKNRWKENIQRVQSFQEKKEKISQSLRLKIARNEITA